MFWVISAGKKDVIGSWQRVPRKWNCYRSNFTVEQDGPVMIGIVGPSFSASSTGRMWIDDVSLIERPRWPQIEISGQSGFDDFPVIVKGGSGSAWGAWISYRDDHDTLQAALLEPDGKSVKLVHQWQIESDAQILNPGLTAAGDGAWLVYAREDGTNWDIYAAELRPEGPKSLCV